jgi:hypothetical protein
VGPTINKKTPSINFHISHFFHWRRYPTTHQRLVRLAYQPAVLFSRNKPATSQQYSSLRTNQHQASAISQPNRLQSPSDRCKVEPLLLWGALPAPPLQCITHRESFSLPSEHPQISNAAAALTPLSKCLPLRTSLCFYRFLIVVPVPFLSPLILN